MAKSRKRSVIRVERTDYWDRISMYSSYINRVLNSLNLNVWK